MNLTHRQLDVKLPQVYWESFVRVQNKRRRRLVCDDDAFWADRSLPIAAFS